MSRTGCTLVCAALTIAVVLFGAPARADAQVVASTKDGSIITSRELDDQVGDKLMMIRTQLDHQQRKVLMEMLAERLLNQEASRRQISQEALEALEIDKKILENPDEEITRLYQMSRARFQGVTEDQARKEIDEALKKRQRRTIRAAFVKQLMTRAGARIQLEAPRVTIEVGNEPVRGTRGRQSRCWSTPISSVRTVRRSRARSRRWPHAIRRTCASSTRTSHCRFTRRPGLPRRPRDAPASKARYREMRDRLFAVQQNLSLDALTKEAGQVGLNADGFAQCMSSRKFERQVEANRVEGERYGVRGTPGFFVNGRFLSGVMSLEGFQEVIDDELARVQAPQTVPSAMAGPAATGRSERR